ncbi:hypothetical protein CRM22_005843 [Opisthorchis felineus]|uniref:Cadherin domain-containing protein n=1 Tax=Opisthorchis felineus TaxID=147828 RepID=A0A4S2LP36_OPIFE|nr:hypothetical protein CRM22_005843 [Opisthorchis felineus]
MSRLRSIVIFISLQPHFMFILILILLFKANMGHAHWTRAPKSTRSTKSNSDEFRVNFVLPDELPANHFIGNIPTQLPSFPLGGNLDLSVSTTIIDALGIAPRLLRVSDSGDLYTVIPIDRDDPDQICGPLQCCRLMVCNLTLTVLFVHPGLDTVTVGVNLQLHDSNDNAPTFAQQTFALWMPEDNGLRFQKSLVGSKTSRSLHPLPHAHDADSDPNGLIGYRLAGTYVAKTTFQLISNLSSGQLSIAVRPEAVLDYDRAADRIFKLTVEAMDGGQPPRTGQLLLLIHLTDLNDNVPLFDKESDSINISENMLYEDPIYVAHATDADSEDNALIRYSMGPGYVSLPNSILKHFSLHPATGELYLRQTFDFEQYEQRNVELRLTAHDAGDPPLSSSMLLTIRVHDVNDNPPQLIVQHNRTILENSEPNQLALRLMVRDADEVSRSVVHCEPEANQRMSPLRFEKSEDGTIMNLFTRTTFDYEVQPRLSYTITCVDSAEPRQIRRFNLTVAIRDENDNAPKFRFLPPHTEGQFNVTVSEAEPVNSIILNIMAEDEDSGENARIAYSLYELRGKATHSSTQANSSLATFKEYFKISKDTGSLFLIKRLDYELINQMDFGVRAMDNPRGSDNERNTASAQIHVTILDINDNPPVLISPSHFTVVEHLPIGTKVGFVQFVDADKGNDVTVEVRGLLPNRKHYITSTLSKPNGERRVNTADYFKLTSGNQIVTTRLIDREETSQFLMYILAVDNGHPVRLSATATITVDVIDINDHKPVIRHPESGSVVIYQPIRLSHLDRTPLYKINDSQLVSEVTPVSKLYLQRRSGGSSALSNYVTAPVVQQVQADDADNGENARIAYTMLGKCNATRFFHIDKNTGIIRFRLQAFHDGPNGDGSLYNSQWIPSPGIYLFCIQLSDHGEPTLTSNAQFFLKVTEPVEPNLSIAQWPSDSANLESQVSHDYFIKGPKHTTNTSYFGGIISPANSSGLTKQMKSGSDINLSNLVISMLLAIFAVTLVCALIAAILWAHSKHRRRHSTAKSANKHLAATSHTEASKWLVSDEQINSNEIHSPVTVQRKDQLSSSSEMEAIQECKVADKLLPVDGQRNSCSNLSPINVILCSKRQRAIQGRDSESVCLPRGNHKESYGFQTISSLCDLIPEADKTGTQNTEMYVSNPQTACMGSALQQSHTCYKSGVGDIKFQTKCTYVGINFTKSDPLEPSLASASCGTTNYSKMPYSIPSTFTGSCPTHGPHYILSSSPTNGGISGVPIQPAVYAVSSVLDSCGGTLHLKQTLEDGTICTIDSLGHSSPYDNANEKTLSWIPIPLMAGSPSTASSANIVCIDPLKTMEPNQYN